MAYRGSTDKRLMIVEIGGKKVGIYYHSPTPSEYIGYHRDKMRYNNGKIESRLTEANLRYGLKVVSGVRPGDLEFRENGVWKALDTNVMTEEEWKAVLERDFVELVDFVGAKVFNPVDGASEDKTDTKDDFEKK